MWEGGRRASVAGNTDLQGGSAWGSATNGAAAAPAAAAAAAPAAAAVKGRGVVGMPGDGGGVGVGGEVEVEAEGEVVMIRMTNQYLEVTPGKTGRTFHNQIKIEFTAPESA